MIDRIRNRVGLGGESSQGPGTRAPQRHMTRREREHRQRQLLLLFTGIAAVIVVLALAIGAFYQYFWFPRQSLASVNGTEIRRTDYMKVRGYEIRQEYARLSQELQTAQPDQQPQMQAELSQLQQELAAIEDGGDVDPNPETIQAMIDDRIVLDNMEELGISVSDADVDAFVLGLFSPLPLSEPTPSPTVEPTAAAWATATSEAFVAGATATTEAQETAAVETAEAAPTEDPNATPDPNVTPVPELTPDLPETPVAELTPDAEGTPDAGETPDADSTPDADATGTVEDMATPAPTETPNEDQAIATSEASFELLEMNFLEPADMSRGDFERLIARPALSRMKVQEHLANQVSSSADQAHLAHILVATQEAAQELLDTRLQEEEFEDVATELSIDEQSAVNGGDLGWGTSATYVAEFSEAAFALEPGEVTEEPVQTQFGWHIIKMIDREEDRPLTLQALNQQKQIAFQTWLDEQREEADIETDVELPSDEPPVPPIG